MASDLNPLDQQEPLHRPQPGEESVANPQREVLPGDSATTRAEKIERHVSNGDEFNESPNKRMKLEHDTTVERPEREKGVAPIKKEYLIEVKRSNAQDSTTQQYDDDAAEASGKGQSEPAAGRGGKKTAGGQNHNRSFGSSRDAIELCRSRAFANEFDENVCKFGQKCKYEHDIRKYLKDGKREDLQTFGVCPVSQVKSRCNAGWRCRFASTHSKEVERDDGRKELILVDKEHPNGFTKDESSNGKHDNQDDDESTGIINVVGVGEKISLRKKQHPLPRSDEYLQWLNKWQSGDEGRPNGKSGENGDYQSKHDNRAAHIEPPPRPSEKRRIYYGPETPVLAPLTTQGNLPFRRLCVELGAQVTWSEMAMGMPLLQGEKQEWALVKAHESEISPPDFYPKEVVDGYDNKKDIRFGVQIAANKPWLAVKTTEVLTNLAPQLRAIDLNCGCPIDLVFRQGAGSALLDSPGKLEKILRGMNTVSKDVPITVKIRMGTKDKQPTAEKLCQRLIMGTHDAQDSEIGPCGVAAITLHGRSRQQRYTRSADWEYIAECASLVKKLKSEYAEATDTIREPDARDLPATNGGMPYFCGNGDVLSHFDYNQNMEHAGVDSCMVGRGALVKPWVFEEIQSNQYLDKSASERLGYIERFCRNGLEYWGSDEIGVGTTRRFLLEWLSFSCRYVPIGLLEYLPPKFGDRPPAFVGRNDLETLLSSSNYKDWIKISEMFLGPAHKNFQFQPKHKSNSYEIEAEG